MLVSISQIEESEKRFKQKKAQPEESILEALHEDEAEEKDTTEVVSRTENIKNREEMIKATGLEPADFAFERAIGKNDSVYSNFCELIAAAKQKVGRIVIKDGTRARGYATGFMVSDRLMLTNWHVFEDINEVRDSEVNFYYEYDVYGRSIASVTFKFTAADFFFSNKELDYCFIAVSPVDVSGKVSLASIGYHYLNPDMGKLGDENIEFMNIIHHPDGDYKQLSIRENRFTKIQDNTLWYASDTSQGSSGSPVFNDQWQIVALHHMGVPERDPNTHDYVDKDGKIIKPVGGKIDISKIHWIANEGIRISVILKDVFQRFPNSLYILNLKKKPEFNNGVLSDNEKPTIGSGNQEANNKGKEGNTENGLSDTVHISFPASLVETNGSVSVSINTGQPATSQSTTRLSRAVTMPDLTEDELLESKKSEIEDGMDYSDCRGYESNFLGIDIPLPKPKKSLQKFAAKLKGSNIIILDYYYFSLIQHAVRKMPIISAINIDGDPKKRKDASKRVDMWLRDNRLDYDVQLNDQYYSHSGFDRGHMSRREDANWGNTPEEAKKFADLTCVYTNACPQVEKLNKSSRSGLWGKLEVLVLEKGAGLEKGKASKISVFNGPIFSTQDPVYKGIQVPMEFWKVILWFNKGNQLKATAFKLSQIGKVGDIHFEELDFDQNLEFKEHQISLKELEKLTQIDFSAIKKFDTFRPTIDNEESLQLNSEGEFVELLKATD